MCRSVLLTGLNQHIRFVCKDGCGEKGSVVVDESMKKNIGNDNLIEG